MLIVIMKIARSRLVVPSKTDRVDGLTGSMIIHVTTIITLLLSTLIPLIAPIT